MTYCAGCNEKLHWYQKTGFNSSWHKACSKSWLLGYRSAQRFAEQENKIHNYKTPWQLYADRMQAQYCQPEKE